MKIVYISLSGNVQSFVRKLEEKLPDISSINIKDLVKNGEEFFEVNSPYIAIVPTYLDGGDGIDTGNNEILTTDLREFIRHKNNKEKLLGVVGSGNKNFNHQYCLTAKQYAEEFNVPFLMDFEMRGLPGDLEKLVNIVSEFDI